jgi:hypothetical protein
MAHGKNRFKQGRLGNPNLKQHPPVGQPQQIKVDIPINQLDDIVCSNCEGALFIQVFAMKHLPALYSPNRKEGTINAPAGSMCVTCGAINNVRRKKPGEEKEKLEQASDNFEKDFREETGEGKAVSGVPGVLQDTEDKAEQDSNTEG